jgi:DNA repair exonuclease SbcCD nuclease subunit
MKERMIKRVYQIADTHIPTYQKLEMYSEQLQKLIDNIEEDANNSGLSPDEMRIVICGDLVNSKNIVTNELNVMASSFIRQLSSIAKVICIAGNHDLVESNTSRTDTVTAIFETAQFDNAIFLDMELGYESGIVYDDNVTWALYSFYDDYKKPDIGNARNDKPDNIVLGLYHGQVVGTKLYNGFVSDSGQGADIFDGCDYVLAGHIHRRQTIKKGNCEIVYSGSVLQKDYGESVTQHGYVIWDLVEKKYEFIDIPSDYGYYNFTVRSIGDINNGEEKLVNY